MEIYCPVHLKENTTTDTTAGIELREGIEPNPGPTFVFREFHLLAFVQLLNVVAAMFVLAKVARSVRSATLFGVFVSVCVVAMMVSNLEPAAYCDCDSTF